MRPEFAQSIAKIYTVGARADLKRPDYPSETFRVLKDKETRQPGEYRTRRLVLEALDQMEANSQFTTMGM